SSFEFSELSVKFGSFAVRIVIVYRPPCTKSFVTSVKTVTCRNVKSVNIESFKGDLAKSALCNENIVNLSLDGLVTCYNSTLSLLI
ncbi:unnamed protein product, partial [Porites lobata]